MLIRITNRCTMGCSHCLTESTPSGSHMDEDTFICALVFARVYQQVPMVMLSGGEPTCHPNLLDYLNLASHAGLAVLLMSNGEQLSKDVLARVLGVQVTNDARFYPRRVEALVHDKVVYEYHIRQVSPFGRALNNGLTCNRHSPMCFNLRSLTRSFGDVTAAVDYLRSTGKMCSPSVNVDGTVVAGEAPSCHPIGTVRSKPDELTAALRDMTCNRCGLVDNLTQEQKVAIGEARIHAVGRG